MTNDIYQQLGAQLAQRGQQANPYASLMQQRPSPMPQMSFGGGAQGNPYAGLMQNLGRQAQMPQSSGQTYGSMPMLQSYGAQGGIRPGGSGLAPIAAQLAQRPSGPTPAQSITSTLPTASQAPQLHQYQQIMPGFVPLGEPALKPPLNPGGAPLTGAQMAALAGTGLAGDPFTGGYTPNGGWNETNGGRSAADQAAQVAAYKAQYGDPNVTLASVMQATSDPEAQRRAYQSWMDNTGRFLPDDATKFAEAKKLGLTPS